MIRANVAEVKARLSELLEQVEAGEVVVVCRRNVPVAELRPVVRRLTGPRRIGTGRGLIEVPDSFFDPLPEDILRAFEGEDP